MNILVTGGAGYIGSTVAYYFLDRGHEVTIIDNLITGKKENIPKKSKFYNCDISDEKKLKIIFRTKYDIVLHFAALINARESFLQKKKYYLNNYEKSKIFLNYCIKKKNKNFIFSSTAAVYGKHNRPVGENFKKKPISPYAKLKLNFEHFIKKKKINYIIFRFFNVAGVENKNRCGFEIKRSKSLFANLLKYFFNQKKFYVDGNDHKTFDNSPVRDFIHVSDLAKIYFYFSHLMQKKKINKIFNCGYGNGYSVFEIFNKFKKKLNRKKAIYKIRKINLTNEIPFSVANTSLLNRFINLNLNKEKKLDTMISSSVKWYIKGK